MNKILRTSLVLSAIGAAVASQAVTFSVDYAGAGAHNGPATTSLGYLGDDFSFATSLTAPDATTPGTITLLDALGTSGLTITLGDDQDASPLRYSGTGTATGFGSYAGYKGSDFSIVTNNLKSYVVSVQGDVQAVPEPASMGVLAIGGVALLRRRSKNKKA